MATQQRKKSHGPDFPALSKPQSPERAVLFDFENLIESELRAQVVN
jgi:hypothetical protein